MMNLGTGNKLRSFPRKRESSLAMHVTLQVWPPAYAGVSGASSDAAFLKPTEGRA
jgi:hypothetical protein